MLTGLRIEDAPLLQTLLAADQRLLMRVGALLQHRLAISQPLLQAWSEINGFKALLLDRQLATADAAHCEELLNIHLGSDHDVAIHHGEDGWRVLCFSDELDNPLLQGHGANDSTGTEPVPTAAPWLDQLPTSVQPAVQALMAASSDADRSAAVEQLRYAKPGKEVLQHLIPLFLRDGAATVREGARRLLVECGARPAVSRLIDHFHEPDERLLPILREELAGLDHTDAELAISALRAALEHGGRASEVLTLAESLTEQLAQSAQLGPLLDLLIHHGNALSLLGLVRQLQRFDHGQRINTLLRQALGQSRNGDARLIGLLVGPGDELDDELKQRALDLLLSPLSDPVDRMPIATALLRAANPEQLVAAFTACSERLRHIPDATAFWLIGEWARGDLISAEQTAAIMPGILHILENGQGPQISTLLEQRLPATLPLDPAQRHAAITAIGELAARTRASRNLELMQTIVNVMATDQQAALWQLLEEHPHANPRRLALIALPLALASDTSEQLDQATARLLAVLGRESFGRRHDTHWNDERALVALTAARVAHLPNSQGNPSTISAIDQAATALGPYGWQALGVIAAGPHCRAERRSALITTFLTHCLGEVSDAQTQTISGSDSNTYIFDSSLSAHTHFVPDLLVALEAIARSTHTPKPLLRHVVERLSDQFLAVARWEVVWAPGNIMQLARLLAGLASDPDFAPHLRRLISDALQTRLSQPEMVRLLAQVLAADREGELAAHAARSLQTVISYHAENRYLDDERSELAASLIEFLSIPDFGDDDQLMRNRIATTLTSLKRHCREAMRQRLAELVHDRPFNHALSERLAWTFEQMQTSG